MNDKQLQLFLSVADHGSFSKAEEVEYVSKQAMLRQINSLEEEVGVKLLHRTSTGITLTEAGQEFYRGAKKMLKLRDSVLSKCRKATPDPDIIRIGQVEHQALLHDVTDAFAIKYPDIKIRKVIHPNHSGEWRVSHNIIDVGETFYTKITARQPNAYTRLADMPYVVAMSHRHPLAGQHSLSLTDLTGYPTILFPRMVDDEYMREIEQVFSKHPGHLQLRDDVDNQVEIAFQCSCSDQLFLTANCFVNSIPELTVIPLDNGWTQEYGIIYRPNPTPPVRKYIDLAVALFGKELDSVNNHFKGDLDS